MRTSISLTRFFFLLLFLSLVVVACKTPEEPAPTPTPTEPTEPEISLPTAEALQGVDLSSGFRTEQMKLSEVFSWTYSIYVPQEIKDGPLPLVVALHGGNGDQASAKDYMLCLPFPALQQLKAIVFAPTGGEWWEEPHSDRIVEFVRLAKLHWPIDSNKVAVTGYSNGGTGSVHFAKMDPSPFSAAIPMGADYKEEICPSIPTYMIHGEDDEFYPLIDLQRTIDNLTANGCEIQLQIVADAVHASACEMKGELGIAGEWLEENVWIE